VERHNLNQRLAYSRDRAMTRSLASGMSTLAGRGATASKRRGGRSLRRALVSVLVWLLGTGW